jgi:glycerol-3-phosphate dehydrogenase
VIRDLPRLAEREFDVLVVGGGIYGLVIGYDAAQRGLSVALVERGDFGAATSFNHLKTIHGGLRYLQSGDLRRMRESILERRTFARIAPRYIAPLAFAMPTQPSLTRNRLAMATALAVDAMVGRDRNDGVDASRHLPSGRVMDEPNVRALFEGTIPSVSSAAVWHDYVMTNGDRLTLAFAKAAAKHGAALANYTRACGPLLNGSRVAGVKARDVLTGHELEIRARVLVNAAGPWAATLFQPSDATARWPLLKAMNLVTSRPARKAALVVPMRGGRALVMLPWQGWTVIGTSESRDHCRADDQDARRAEVDGFVGEINETFPALRLDPAEVTLVHRGVVPAAAGAAGVTLQGHSRLLSQDGMAGMISVVGVKYTTARLVAERAVDEVFRTLGRTPPACRTSHEVLPGAGLGDRDPADPVMYAIRDEMAHTLADVIVRRTELGAAGYPGEHIVMDVANRMQSAMGWSEERKRREIEALRRVYEVV